jgi:guanosine-3',5'-bis(diphosphate) 3'-pyrophosphohydrolase
MKVSIENLLLFVKKYIIDQKEIALINKSFELAKKAHEGQYRKSGEEYISHPIAVAIGIAKIQAKPSMICAAILHDTIEDTNLTYQKIKEEISKEVADYVQALSINDQINENDNEIYQQLNNLYQNYEVVVIKLFDRLHNMQTLSAMPKNKQLKKAAETLEYYVPIAHRLGLGSLRTELEDLAFIYLDNKNYQLVKLKVDKLVEDSLAEFSEIIKKIESKLDNARLDYTIEQRVKNYYSIYRKQQYKEIPIEEINDILAIRIITNDRLFCYKALGIVHETISPIPGKIKDYISLPKSNLYQAIHTKFRLSNSIVAEVQIKTKEMHRHSEYGFASHYNYKNSKYSDKMHGKSQVWVDQLENQIESKKDKLDYLKTDISIQKNIIIFTTKGDYFYLPSNSYVLDFAFLIHTQIGIHAETATINGNRRPLNTKLKNGDLVRINTTSEPNCESSWLEIVNTRLAKNKIKDYLNNLEKNQNIFLGKEILNWIFKSNKIPENMYTKIINKIKSKYISLESNDELYVSIATTKISEVEINEIINKYKVEME